MEGPLRVLQEAVLTVFRVFQQSVLSLRYNWGLGFLSLALAVSLWVFVTERDNPTRVQTVPGSVPVEEVNVPPDLAVVSKTPSSVRVRVSASESVHDRLSAEDFRATVDLSGVTAKEVTLDVNVESEESRADAVETEPRQVRVTLESVTTRLVPVTAQPVGTLPLGFRTGELSVEPGEAQVSGPENLVERVAAVEADVSLTGVRTDIEQRVPLRPRDERGGEIETLTVEPETATVRVAVIQVDYTVASVVRAQLGGRPAEGFNVAVVRVEPPFINVSGPLDVLQSLDVVAGVPTEEVSIDNARADVTRTVALRLPEGARADREQVTVTVDLEPAQGQFVFAVAPRASGLPPELVADLPQGSVQVTLAGSIVDLEAISPEQIAVSVDLSGRDAGTHRVPVQVQAPPGTGVVLVTPQELEVTVRPR